LLYVLEPKSWLLLLLTFSLLWLTCPDVAVAGLPEKREDHAVVMALFARDCLVAFNRLVKQMEVDLGPDTAGTCQNTYFHHHVLTRTD
jgi:hypothetical protein